MKFTKFYVFTAISLSFSVGCAEPAADDARVDESEVQSSVQIAEGDFKLYTAPSENPTPLCDVYTSLSLRAGTAFLREHVEGICQIRVDPDPRDFTLTSSSVDGCGSTIYLGKVPKTGENHRIQITDNRTRLCNDIVPAEIVVTETIDGTARSPLYSASQATGGAFVKVEGTLASVMATGSETTGTAIESDNVLHELVLNSAQTTFFEDGRKALVEGRTTKLYGVEIPVREAIEVETFVVCPDPGTVNCMPGGSNWMRHPACSRTDWVEANCEGVRFVY